MKWITGTLLFALILGIGCSQHKSDEYAMITFAIGEVSRNGAAVSVGDLLKENDVIVTGTDAFCDLKIGASVVRIKQKTKLVISQLVRSADTESTILGLDKGKMLCKPKRLLKSESFLVKTPTAVAGVRGTQFSVETDMLNTTRIRVLEGKVKVAKRVKQLESSLDRILEAAPPIEKEEQVVVTQNDVARAERTVEAIMKKQEGGSADTLVEAVIKQAPEQVTVSKREVSHFLTDEAVEDKRDMIAVKPRPQEEVQRIAQVVKREREAPRPNGRLLITRFDVYFIKDGKVEWEAKVVNPPVKQDSHVYIAAGGYVFCAAADGPVIWRKKIDNDGKLEIREEVLIVIKGEKETKLDLKTGDKL